MTRTAKRGATRSIGAMAAMLLPGLGLAQETLGLEGTEQGFDSVLRYTYIEGAWITQDLDDANIDGEGYAVHAAMALDRSWHLFADYTMANVGASGIDLETALAGVGYAFPVATAWDLIARAGGARVKLSGEDVEGWGVQALARGQLAARLELEGGAQHVDLGRDGGDDTSLLAAVRFNVTDWFSLGIGGRAGGDVTEYGLTVRLATH